MYNPFLLKDLYLILINDIFLLLSILAIIITVMGDVYEPKVIEDFDDLYYDDDIDLSLLAS